MKDEGAVVIGKALEGSNPQLRELDFSSNMLRRAGATCLARAVVTNKPDFVLLNIDDNAISEEGIEEVKEILRNGKKDETVLGSLDDNEPEGEEESGEEEDAENGGGEVAVEAELDKLCFQ
ncbi:hypothetical protein HPP92_020190 [Vanilla planifolia]|uniref:Uncharacterized protein n=1 Tax=Vanilla planifolia TaxID=51239 RepID=A0A835Q4A1_VANPL|nr:hypothetical protein HPP92_020190 [Vanilla planifolia]